MRCIKEGVLRVSPTVSRKERVISHIRQLQHFGRCAASSLLAFDDLMGKDNALAVAGVTLMKGEDVG